MPRSTNDKDLLRAVGNMFYFDQLRQTGQMDELALRHMTEAENLISGCGGRKVIEAVLQWNRTGRVMRDPRPTVAHITDEMPPKRNGYGRHLGVR